METRCPAECAGGVRRATSLGPPPFPVDEDDAGRRPLEFFLPPLEIPFAAAILCVAARMRSDSGLSTEGLAFEAADIAACCSSIPTPRFAAPLFLSRLACSHASNSWL